MMMCDLLIVIDPKHPDRNSLDELVGALECMGATIVEIDTSRHVIEAVVPAPHVATAASATSAPSSATTARPNEWPEARQTQPRPLREYGKLLPVSRLKAMPHRVKWMSQAEGGHFT